MKNCIEGENSLSRRKLHTLQDKRIYIIKNPDFELIRSEVKFMINVLLNEYTKDKIKAHY